MSYSITVSTEDYNFVFKRCQNHVLVNGKACSIDMDRNKNPSERKDILKEYKSLLKRGKSKEYASAKAALLFASYTEVGLSPVIELMDHIVLYLLNLEKLTELNSDMHINVGDSEIYVQKRIDGSKSIKKSEPYEIAITSSVHIDYNYVSLLDALINDNNKL